jgi:hypothetical protein
MVATVEEVASETRSASIDQPRIAMYREVYKRLADSCRDHAQRPAVVDEIWTHYDARLAQLAEVAVEPVIITALDGLSDSVREIMNGGGASDEDRLEWLDLYPRNVLMLLEPRSGVSSFADPEEDDEDNEQHSARNEDDDLDD